MNLKADLLRGPERIELIETHISLVFLHERDVYKVKKPVDLGFLDFRTIEQRRAACEAEVRLNARLAPDVYIDVVPVRRDRDGHACIGGDGAIVDYAVHMARLPDARRADVLLARHALDGDAIDAIAQRLAAFHASTRADERTASFGTQRAIRENVEENFAQTRDTIDDCLFRDEARELERWQAAFVRDHQALFEKRIRDGRIKDGHGDLRLEHVYLDDAQGVTVIDCIEFNDRFRFADVCADIAFLSMDLAAHGRVDLAERFIATYAREANDFELYALVDFYESYRAFVRGKVATFVAADEGVDVRARENAAATARRYFLLALAASRKSLLRPMVIAVGGVIASGKSTIASEIADETSAPVIEADRTRKAMLGVEATRRVRETPWTGAYDPAFTGEVYAEVLRRAAVVLESGRPVILDASFRSRDMRRAARDLARAHHVPFRFVECRATPEVCRARLVRRERTGGVSDGRLEIFDAFCKRFEPVSELADYEHIVVDTTRTVSESSSALRARLATWPLGLAG